MNYLEYTKNNLLAALNRPEYIEYAAGNPYAEVDSIHFLNVGDLVKQLWERKYHTQAPDAVVIAAWYHDFDRVFPDRKIDTKNAPRHLYEKVKEEHSRNCANIFEEWNPELPILLKQDIMYLIEKHEFGGVKKENGSLEELIDKFTRTYNLNRAADDVCEADGLSFFAVIIHSYSKWADEDRVRKKIEFSFNKLSEVGKTMVREMHFKDRYVAELMKEAIGRITKKEI